MLIFPSGLVTFQFLDNLVRSYPPQNKRMNFLLWFEDVRCSDMNSFSFSQYSRSCAAHPALPILGFIRNSWSLLHLLETTKLVDAAKHFLTPGLVMWWLKLRLQLPRKCDIVGYNYNFKELGRKDWKCFCIFLGFSKDENGAFDHRMYKTRAKPLFLWEHHEQITDVVPQNKLLLCSEIITPSFLLVLEVCLTFSFSS